MHKLVHRISLTTATVALLLTIFAVSPYAPKAAALSGSEFNPSRIIDDSVFYNSQTLTVGQIQDFLNAKVPVCDTWGTQPRGSVTRAQYGSSVGNPAPYTCLKDYRQDTTAKPYEAGLCNGFGTSNQSAADIIYNVAQSCGVNPKVLLVLLQKEQSLITDDWPWPIQYRSATGYGCPDTAACDTQYYGFFNQVYAAARGYKYYAKYSGSFNYIAGHNNTIQYNPNAGCGSSSVFIQNQATAGLYNYTPYQPNAAALNNLYGTGDGCSAYGNRNFWRMFNDWFGSTTDNIPISYTMRLVGAITASPANPIAGQATTITYTVQNYGSQPVAYQTSVLQCRFNKTSNCDPGWGAPMTIAAGDQHTFTDTITPGSGANYSLTPYFEQGGVWYRYASDAAGGNVLTLNIPDMRVITPVVTSPENPVAGDAYSASFTVQNYGSQPVTYQTSVLQCRFNGSTNCDSNYGGAVTLNPSQQLRVTYYLTAPTGGTYTLVPYFQQNNVWYQYNVAGNGQSSLDLKVPDMDLVGAITVTPADPIPGQSVAVSYTVQNNSTQAAVYQDSVLQCRLNTSTNCDPAYGGVLTINPGTQHTFTDNLTVRAGGYAFVPHFQINNNWYRYSSTTPGGNTVRLDVPPYVADMRLITPITSTPADPIPGQPTTVSFTVKNFGTKPGIYQTSILQCRFNTSTNCDPAYDAPLTINPGAQHAFSISFPAVKAGLFVFTPYYLQNDTWHTYSGDGTYSNNLRVDVPAYVADMRLVGSIGVTPASATSGQTLAITYTVKNYGDKPAIFQSSILQCRFNTTTNCDPAYDAPLTINPGSQQTFNVNFSNARTGSYVFTPYFLQNDSWHRFTPDLSSSNTLRVDVR